jgi:hypothetical protein
MLIIRFLCRTAMFDADKKFTGFQHSTFISEVPNEVMLVEIGNIRLNYQADGGSVEVVDGKPVLRVHLSASYYSTDSFSHTVANTLRKTFCIQQPPRINNGIALVVPEVYGSEIAEIKQDDPEPAEDKT